MAMQRALQLVREIDRVRWPAYLEDVSEGLSGSLMSVELDASRGDPRLAGSTLLLTALAYDATDDVLAVAGTTSGPGWTTMLRHFVGRPRHVWVDSAEGVLPSVVAITDDVGARTVVRITQPPAFGG